MKNSLAGVVMAGGESRRMGQDKAGLVVGGEVLWRRQLRVLAAAGAAPIAIGRRSEQAALGDEAVVVRDELTGIGPLAGLHAALRWAAEATWLAVLAVDLPEMDAAWFEELRRRCAPGVGAVARSGGGFEPLAAIYPCAALAVVAAQAASGEFSLQRLIARLVAERRMAVWDLPAEGDARLRNWNSPADRAT